MTADAAALLALAAEVEALDGPSREVDARVWLLLTPGATRKEGRYTHAASGRECVIDETRDAAGHLIVAPSYTGSVDAVLALIADALPGYGLTVSIGAVGPRGKAKGREWSGAAHVRIFGWAPECSVEAAAASVALGLLAAVLRAAAARGVG